MHKLLWQECCKIYLCSSKRNPHANDIVFWHGWAKQRRLPARGSVQRVRRLIKSQIIMTMFSNYIWNYINLSTVSTSRTPVLIVGVQMLTILEKNNQPDATEWFIALIICSTCFGHFYAHHQEIETICVSLLCAMPWLLVVGGQVQGSRLCVRNKGCCSSNIPQTKEPALPNRNIPSLIPYPPPLRDHNIQLFIYFLCCLHFYIRITF